jgi:hypothetical protein
MNATNAARDKPLLLFFCILLSAYCILPTVSFCLLPPEFQLVAFFLYYVPTVYSLLHTGCSCLLTPAFCSPVFTFGALPFAVSLGPCARFCPIDGSAVGEIPESQHFTNVPLFSEFFGAMKAPRAYPGITEIRKEVRQKIAERHSGKGSK